MGRHGKVNLPYFELDCHMDDKIELIEAEYGLKGFAIIIKLYQRIYGGEHGYYCDFTPDIALLLAAHYCGSSGGVYGKVGTASGEGSLPGFPKNLITNVVAASIRRDIFSERLFKEYRILTSQGIQKQYLKATAKRETVEMKKEYLLVIVPKNRVNVVINSISSGRNEISGGRNAVSDGGNIQSKVCSGKDGISGGRNAVSGGRNEISGVRNTQSKSNNNSNIYINRDIEPIHRFEEFMSAYPEPKGGNRHLAGAAYADLVTRGLETEDNLVVCAKNYAEACQVKGTQERYIKSVQNFLKDMSFEAYLPGNYRKPLPAKPRNCFADFPQRQYDYGQLEARLLKK